MLHRLRMFLKGVKNRRFPRCPACGVRARLSRRPTSWPELVEQWGLTPQWAKWFEEREGAICGFCHCQLRVRCLAEALLSAVSSAYGTKATSLTELIRLAAFRELHVAEINSAGGLHQFLQQLPHLSYSEYGSKSPAIHSENLIGLSFPDSAFDLVITSESLEHVPDIDLALKEIERILKPGGFHVFTVPMVTDWQSTRHRARLVDGKVEHDMPASFHGGPNGERCLVFYEFGRDFLDRCSAAGFHVTMHQRTKNLAVSAIIARKIGTI